MKYSLLAFVAWLSFTTAGFAQQKPNTVNAEDKKLIQFSGVIVSSDSLDPIPFATIMIKNSRRGTTSDYYGYFSFVAALSDTIQFSSVGYKPAFFVIPDSLSTNRYSLIQMLQSDTFLLREAVVYPWPSREQFKEAFLNLDVPDDNLSIAQKNLRSKAMRDLYLSMPNDGAENYQYAMKQVQSQLYYAGQYPPISLMNPVAWAKFIEAWKRGDFKKKE